MSLSLQPITTVGTQPGVCHVTQERVYDISLGGQNVMTTVFISDSVSNSGFTITCNPPDETTLVDPCVTLFTQFRCDFTYNPAKPAPTLAGGLAYGWAYPTAGVFLTQAGAPAGGGAVPPPPTPQRFLKLGDLDGIRCMATDAVLDNLRVNVNTDVLNCSIGDYVSVFERFGNTILTEDTSYSATTGMPDQFIKYLDADVEPQLVNSSANGVPMAGVASGQPDQGLVGVARNPLGTYGDDGGQMTRGSFNYDYVYNPIYNTATSALPAPAITYAVAAAAIVAGTPLATVIFTIRSPILLAPFSFGRVNEPGLIGIRSMAINGSFAANINRVWSCADGFGNPLPLTPYLPPSYGTLGFPKSVTTNVLQVQASFRYIQPSLDVVLPKTVEYPYYESVPQTIQLSGSNLAAGQGVTAASTGNMFSSSSFTLPSLPRRFYVYLQPTKSQRTFTMSDFFGRIDRMTLKLGARDGIFASYTSYDFYRMASMNGSNLSYVQWSKTVGSVICIDLSADVGLGPLEAPGLNKPTQVQFQGSFTDLQEPNMPPVAYELSVIPVYEGVLVLSPGVCTHQTGILTPQDILNVSQGPLTVMTGGSKGGALGWSDAWHGIKRAGRFAWENRDAIINAVNAARKLYSGKGRRRSRSRSHSRGRGVQVPGLKNDASFKENFYGGRRSKSPRRKSRSPRRKSGSRKKRASSKKKRGSRKK